MVVPPLIRRRDLGAAVLDRDAAERVVLALRVALPVVRHLDPGQRGMAVEDDAEEVPGLPLVPVAGRVHADQRGNVRVGVRRADLQPHPAVVGDRQHVIHRVQLAAGLRRVVHAGHAAAQLEARAPGHPAASRPPRAACPGGRAGSARPGQPPRARWRRSRSRWPRARRRCRRSRSRTGAGCAAGAPGAPAAARSPRCPGCRRRTCPSG